VKTDDTEALGIDRELNQARSKPDTVDQPLRTARTIVHHYNSTQYYSRETVFINIPLPAGNITSQISGEWASRGFFVSYST